MERRPGHKWSRRLRKCWRAQHDSNMRPSGPQTGEGLSQDTNLRLVACEGLKGAAIDCTGDGPRPYTAPRLGSLPSVSMRLRRRIQTRPGSRRGYWSRLLRATASRDSTTTRSRGEPRTASRSRTLGAAVGAGFEADSCNALSSPAACCSGVLTGGLRRASCASPIETSCPL
jgi:hypothetical protein